MREGGRDCADDVLGLCSTPCFRFRKASTGDKTRFVWRGGNTRHNIVHRAICNVKAAGDKKIEGDTKPVNRTLLFAYSTARIRDRQKKKRKKNGYWYTEGTARGRSYVSELTSCRNRGIAGCG